MPRNVNPASITVGAGIAPQGTVEDNSLRHPQRDVEPLRAHLLDPNNAHMASAIGIVDAGGYYSSTDVEGALQELGGGGAAGRHNGLVIGGTFTSGPGLLTLDTPTVVLIGGAAVSFGGATVVLPPSVTRYVWIDPTTSTLTASAVLPPVSSEPILIAKVTTDGGANVTSSQDARFFVANLDRKLDYTLRSDGTAVNDASEACFVTLDAALFWLENYVATAQERKALVLVRGTHTISSTVAVPSGIPNIEFRGEGAATFATGAALAPMFNVSGTVGLTFTGITFRCDHAGSVAIRTATGALACSNVTVQNCRFTVGGSTWDAGVVLNAATPAIQQGHRVLNSQFTVNNNGVLITSAVDCVVRDCTFTGTSAAFSSAVTLARIVPNGENCVVENVKVVSGFGTPFNITTYTSTLRDSQASGGGSVVGGVRTVVDGCAFSGITDTTAGLSISPSAVGGAVVSNTSVSTTTVWAAPDNPTGIRVAGNGVVVTGCTVSGFYNVAGNNGAGVRLVGSLDNKVTDTDISNCHTGVEVLVGAEGAVVEGCTIAARVRGIYSDVNSSGTSVANTTISLDATTGLTGIVLEGVSPSVVGCQIKTTRPLNNYLVGEVPAGILCGSALPNGPYTITGCTFTNFYNTVGQVGGGVVYTEGVNGLSVTGCIFNEGGVFGTPAATLLANVTVTGCQFYTAIAGVENPGVTLSVGVDLYNVGVSGCTFEFSNITTRAAVKVQGNTVRGAIVADCTYRAGGGATPQFVDVVANSTGEGVAVTGNTVKYSGPAPVLGVLNVLGVSNLVVANNSFNSIAVATAKSLVTDAKQVGYTGNTVLNMNGITLVNITGFFPLFTATGNTFDGGNNAAAVGIQLTSAAGGMAIADTTLADNTFASCLHAVRFVNTIGTLTTERFILSGNNFVDCRYGVTLDVVAANGFVAEGNTFVISDYALYQSNAACIGKNIKVDGNLVTQTGFVGPVLSSALLQFSGEQVLSLSISQNQVEHEGSVGAVGLSISGRASEDVSVDGNTVRNENNTMVAPIAVSLTVSNAATPQVNNVSLSRNKVNHFGGGYAAVGLTLTGNIVGAANVFSNVHMDDNLVVVVQNTSNNLGVWLRGMVGGVGVTPTLRGASLCRNTVVAYGPSVECTTSEFLVTENVLMCDNTASASNVGAAGVFYFKNEYGGAIPVGAKVSNVSLCRNAVRNGVAAYAVRVDCEASVFNMALDDNHVQDHGGAALTAGFNNASVQNLSVSGNKVQTVAGSAIFVGNAATVNGLNVSNNLIQTVEGSAIFVGNTDVVNGLNVSDNLIQQALVSGGIPGEATIEVSLNGGNGFVFSGNRLGVTSRKGIYVSGATASSQLESASFTGNTVDFTGGAGAPEEGIYVFWQHLLATVTATGNTVRGADAGIYIDGGLPTSLGIPSSVRGVAVTGNSITADTYGVWVSNHTTNGGGGVATLDGVVVSNNTIAPILASGAMSYGVLVDTVFGTLNKVTVLGNTVDAGTTSTGSCITVDANDAVPTQVSVTDNSTVNGYRGVFVLGNGTERFSEFSVCRNRVLDADSIGIHVTGMASLRNLAVDDNSVQNVDALPFTGQGISVNSNNIQNESLNVSVSGNSVSNTQGQGILLQLLRSANNPEMRNVSVCNNRISDWNDGGLYTTLVPAITVNTSTSGANAHALYNLNVSNNNCMNATDDYVSGFSFSLDEKTRQVAFAHNQVLLNNQANAAAMAWTFTNTGGDVPLDFSFMGNQFRNTNGAVPVYTGATAKYATFYGNIGSAVNFWTTFATSWSVYVPNAAIGTHNIDNGTV
jgi:hypothetical protein